MRSSNLLGMLAGLSLSMPAVSDIASRPVKLSPNAVSRSDRLRHGEYPSGYSGAKLARKALKGTVGKAAIR